MRKPISVIFALFLALALICASAENLGELLAGSQNRSVGNESAVYDAFYRIFDDAEEETLLLSDWAQVTNYISKCATRDDFDAAETVFDSSISAYEKIFLMALDRSTLSDETASEIVSVFEASVDEIPEKTASMYISDEDSEAFIPVLLAQVMPLIGWSCIPEAVDNDLTLYAVSDESGQTIISAADALTTLPGAILIRFVPTDLIEESASVLCFIGRENPCAIDWAKLAGGDDIFFDEYIGEEDRRAYTAEEKEASILLWTELLREVIDFAESPNDEKVDEISDIIGALSGNRAKAVSETGGMISLRYVDHDQNNDEGSPADKPTPTATSPDTTLSPTPAGPTPTPDPTAIDVPEDYSNDYVIYVSKGTHSVAIIGRDQNGKFTNLLRTFSTGIGKAGQTRPGRYTLSKKERWHSWSGGSYSPYSCRLSNGTFIHGPMYTAKDPNSMTAESYNEIGTDCSSGCLRTTCAAAGWVYYNCSTGTLMIITDDSRYSAPRPKKIPKKQTYDPTDPGANPEIPITDFNLTPASLSLRPGETAVIKVVNIKPSNNSTGDKFKYSSSKTGVATVTSDGKVTAVGDGTAKITVTADDIYEKSRSITVNVSSVTPTPAPTLTPMPTDTVTPLPTDTVTPLPTDTVTQVPTDTPTPAPTDTPTHAPSDTPTPAPTDTLTPEPTYTPAPELTDTLTPAPTDTLTPAPTAKIIDKDSDAESIKYVQYLLAKLKYIDEDEIDGVFGNSTEKAVSAFQAKVNDDEHKEILLITGAVDELTLKYLEEYVKKDEQVTAAPSGTKTQNPTASPAPESDETTSPEPTSTPPADTTSDPGADQTADPTSDPGTDQTGGPSPDPTSDPEGDPASDPSPDPAENQDPEPTQGPTDPANNDNDDTTDSE